MAQTPTSVSDGLIALVTLSTPEGDRESPIAFRPAKIGKNAHLTDHKDHVDFVDSVIRYFGLSGRPDGYRRKPLPKEVGKGGESAHYVSDLQTFRAPGSVWSVDVVRVTHPTWAYIEDDGTFIQEYREARNLKMVEAKEEQKTRRAKAAGKEPKPEKAPREKAAPATVAGFPFTTKPKEFVHDGKTHTVKVFGKTHREKMDQATGRRVEDPNTQRTAKDDLFTFKATAYQLGKVSGVLVAPKGVVIVAQNGVGLLQSISPKDKEEWASLLETIADKGGFKGQPVTVK